MRMASSLLVWFGASVVDKVGIEDERDGRVAPKAKSGRIEGLAVGLATSVGMLQTL